MTTNPKSKVDRLGEETGEAIWKPIPRLRCAYHLRAVPDVEATRRRVTVTCSRCSGTLLVVRGPFRMLVAG